MKKTRKTFRLGALLLIVCLISTVMLSGTFAKYTSEYAGQDTALVARWSFTAQGDGTIMGATGDNTELALFDHLYATHINQKAADGTTFIIAPGVKDEFTLKMNYIADVDADVLIDITALAGNAAVPVEYSVDDEANWVTLANLPDALSEKIILTNVGGAIERSDPDAAGSFRIVKVANNSNTPVAISQTVKWRWAYNVAAQSGTSEIVSSDTTDTTLGTASQTAYNSTNNRTHYGIKVDLTATQVVPEQVATTPITAIAAISGTVQVGQTLTAGALTPGAATASYQWQICDTSGGAYSDITGATLSTYVIASGDSGKYIKVVATGINAYSGTQTSAATTQVAP
jgi:hypothetical protein